MKIHYKLDVQHVDWLLDDIVSVYATIIMLESPYTPKCTYPVLTLGKVGDRKNIYYTVAQKESATVVFI